MGKNIRSQVAGVAVKKHGSLGAWGWGLLAVTLAVSLIPVVGPGIGFLVDKHRINKEAKAEKKELAKWYAPQIAAQLGIRPEDVNVHDLELAAQNNPTFASMLDKVQRERTRQTRGSFVATAVATPLSMVMPGAGLATKIPEVALTMGASTVASNMGKDRLMVDDVASMINEKRTNGQQITAEDAFLMSIAHDKQMQDQIAKANGKPFHKMPEAEQQAVMRSMPDYYAVAQKKAYAVNQGLISEQDLVVQAGEDVKASGGFAGKFAPKVKAESHVAQLQASRAAASNEIGA
jgi:hypothetical protein